MGFDQQQFVPDENALKDRQELMKMTNEKSSEVDKTYEQKAINNSGCVLSLSSMKQLEQSLGV